MAEVRVEVIAASGKIAVSVMMELRQREFYGIGIPNEGKTSVVVSIFKGKHDVMSCGSYGGGKLLEYAMKILERLLERRTQTTIS